MKTLDIIEKELESKLSGKRFRHSINVMKTAIKMSELYGADPGKAASAGLLHDCARHMDGQSAIEMCDKLGIKTDVFKRAQPELLHGSLGAYMAQREFEVNDEDILASIRSHTTGRENMSLLEKIIYVADCIEPDRYYEGVDKLREAAVNNIDRAVILALDSSIKHVIIKGAVIHPDSILARNYLIMSERRKSDV